MRPLLLAVAALVIAGPAFAQQAPERQYQAYSDPAYAQQGWERNGWGWNAPRRSSAPGWGLHHGDNPMGSDANGN